MKKFENYVIPEHLRRKEKRYRRTNEEIGKLKEEINELRKQGVKNRDIIKRLNISRRTFYRHANVKDNFIPLFTLEYYLDTLIKCYSNGVYSKKEVAKLLGVSRMTLLRYEQKHNYLFNACKEFYKIGCSAEYVTQLIYEKEDRIKQIYETISAEIKNNKS